MPKQADGKPGDTNRHGHVGGEADVPPLQHPAQQEADAPAHALEGVVGHFRAVHQQLARRVEVLGIGLDGGKDRHRHGEGDAGAHHRHVLFRVGLHPAQQSAGEPHHREAGERAHQHVLRRMHAQKVPAEGDEHHDKTQRDARRPGQLPPDGAAAEEGSAVHAVAAGEGVARRRRQSLRLRQNPGVPNPRPVDTGGHLQQAVDHPVAAPAHEKIGAEVPADAPVDQRRDDEHRFHLSDVAHFAQKFHEARAGAVAEILQQQQISNVHISLPPGRLCVLEFSGIVS